MYYPQSIKVSNKFFYLTGEFCDSIRFDNVTLQSDSSYPSFLYKFDTNGVARCGNVIDNYNFNHGNNSVASNTSDFDVFFSAGISGTHIIGQDTLKGNWANPFSFLARWSCDTLIPLGTVVAKPTEEWRISPNPSAGSFNFFANENINQRLHIDIYNLIGEKVYSGMIFINDNRFRIDLRNQTDGLYLYTLTNRDGTLSQEGKLMIEK